MRYRHVPLFALIVSLAVGGCSDPPQSDSLGVQGGSGPEQAADPAARPMERVVSVAAGASAQPDAFPAELLPSQVVPELEPIAPPAGGRALFSGVVNVAPGDDVTYCTYIDRTPNEVTYIHNTAGTQSRYGHHAVLLNEAAPRRGLCLLEEFQG